MSKAARTRPAAPGAAPPPGSPRSAPIAREPFVGRRWLLRRVGTWARSATRTLLLTGPAGAGKSAIVRHLATAAAPFPVTATTSTARSGSHWLSAVHVCQVALDESRSAVRFAESISAQLAEAVPGFGAVRDRMLSSGTRAPVTVSGSAVAGTVEPGGLNVGVYVELIGLPVRDVVDRLIRRPMQELQPRPDAAPVVLVDALDESLGYGEDVGIVQVIRSLSVDTPIRWLLTSRPDPRVLDELRKVRRIDLIDDCPAGVDDIAAYLRLRLDDIRAAGILGDDAKADRRLVTRLSTAADGNFLYARYVINDLLADPVRLAQAHSDPGALHLPAGLAGVYGDFLDRELRRPEPHAARQRWRQLYRPLLATLAVAFDPGLTADELARLLRVSVVDVSDALEDCRQLLDEARGPGGRGEGGTLWRIYHPSFREFLTTGDDRIADPADVHATVAEGLYGEWDGAWRDADDYALAHTVGHLIAVLEASGSRGRVARGGAPGRLVGLLTDVSYVVARILREGPLPLLADLAQALRVLPATDPGTRTVAEVRGVLVREAIVLRTATIRAEYTGEPLTDTFVTQQLHNRAVIVGARSVVDATGIRLDQSSHPHARLRWYAGAERYLQAVLEAHVDVVLGLAALPGGQLISAGGDEEVLVWDPAVTASPIEELSSHRGAAGGLAVLPDGRLASGGLDGKVRISVPSPKAVPLVLKGHAGPVWILAVLPDGRLVSAGYDGTIRVRDPAGEAEPVLIPGHAGPVWALAVLPDGTLVSAGDDGTVRTWGWTSNATSVELRSERDRVRALAVLPGGQLVSAGDYGTVRIRDGTDIGGPPLMKHNGAVMALAVLPDGRLASGGQDGIVRIRDLTTDADPIELPGHRGTIRALAVLPDGRLASAATDWTVRVWEPPRSRAVPLTGHADWVRTLATLPDGHLVSASDDGTLRIWDQAGQAPPVQLGSRRTWTTAFDKGWAHHFAVLADGRLAVEGEDGTVQVWDPKGSGPPVEPTAGLPTIRAMVGLHDGRLAWAAESGLWLWDVDGGAAPTRLTEHSGPVDALSLLSDGRLASALDDGSFWIWDPTGRRDPVQLSGHRSWSHPCVVLPDGRLATSGDGTTVQIWDESGQPVRVLATGHVNPVETLAVLSDGRLASSDRAAVRILDPDGDTAPAELTGHIAMIMKLVTLPDGRLVTSSVDETVRIVDPVRHSASIAMYGLRVSCLRPVGSASLAVGHQEGWVSLYDLGPRPDQASSLP